MYRYIATPCSAGTYFENYLIIIIRSVILFVDTQNHMNVDVKTRFTVFRSKDVGIE